MFGAHFMRGAGSGDGKDAAPGEYPARHSGKLSGRVARAGGRPLKRGTPAVVCGRLAGSCGEDGTAGHCAPIPGGCPDIWDPVCGCDGRTYGNGCEADAAAVSARYHGTCEDPCRPTLDGFGCTVCSSQIPEDVCRASVLHLDIQTGAITTLDCDCMNISACHIEFGNASPHAEGNCNADETCQVISRDSDNDGIRDTFFLFFHGWLDSTRRPSAGTGRGGGAAAHRHGGIGCWQRGNGVLQFAPRVIGAVDGTAVTKRAFLFMGGLCGGVGLLEDLYGA